MDQTKVIVLTFRTARRLGASLPPAVLDNLITLHTAAAATAATTALRRHHTAVANGYHAAAGDLRLADTVIRWLASEEDLRVNASMAEGANP
jgi:hypothetical protein